VKKSSFSTTGSFGFANLLSQMFIAAGSKGSGGAFLEYLLKANRIIFRKKLGFADYENVNKDKK
jgi:hypothetical protein